MIDGTLDKFEQLTEQMREQYSRAEPYPHCCIDDLFPPDLLRGVIEEVRQAQSNAGWSDFEHKDRAKKKRIISVEELSRGAQNTADLLSICTSSRFIRGLETLTGIKGLLLDPHYYNSGFHQMERGGFLKIHRDFFRHIDLDLFRRVNIILYLNEDWKEEYGGYLELCDTNLENSVYYYPFINRMVVSTVTADALHGNPEPLNCPPDRSRLSFALWYFTALIPEEELMKYELTSNDGWYDKDNLSMRPSKPLSQMILPPVVKDFLFSPSAVAVKFTPPFVIHGLTVARRWMRRRHLRKNQDSVGQEG
ncbi:MAG TPA: 2OG-Fe(II) oxygenase [Acidobacteriota bacterium]|nr:2OG-Fe(II) oxygenase [Acidobacteriota bacterium]